MKTCLIMSGKNFMHVITLKDKKFDFTCKLCFFLYKMQTWPKDYLLHEIQIRNYVDRVERKME